MKKILKGSVIITAQNEHYWVVEHKKGVIKVLNEGGLKQNLSESSASDSRIIDGKDAMEIIKRFWY